MSQRTIYSGQGQVRARLDEGGNTQLFIYNRQGQPLGFYHTVQDRTYTMSGQYVGPGDQRMSLIED
jgi:hypothetical protein